MDVQPALLFVFVEVWSREAHMQTESGNGDQDAVKSKENHRLSVMRNFPPDARATGIGIRRNMSESENYLQKLFRVRSVDIHERQQVAGENYSR